MTFDHSAQNPNTPSRSPVSPAEKAHEERGSLKFDTAVKAASGEIRVTVMLSAEEAGVLKTKMADGDMPAQISVVPVTDSKIVFQGDAAAVKAALAELYFAPNPQYKKDFVIRLETQHANKAQHHEVRMHYDEGARGYHPLPLLDHASISISASIYEGLIASELSNQRASLIQANTLITSQHAAVIVTPQLEAIHTAAATMVPSTISDFAPPAPASSPPTLSPAPSVDPVAPSPLPEITEPPAPNEPLLAVPHSNLAPVVVSALADQSTTVSAAFSYTVPAASYNDPESAPLTYTATKADGTALPAWLSFNGTSRAFSGTPVLADSGILSVKVTASDGELSVSDTLDITVGTHLGGSGNDMVTGSSGADRMFGLSGNDYLSGSSGGADSISGGAGNDTLYGGSNSGGQTDTLTGGADNDVFLYRSTFDTQNVDRSTITDFTKGEDKIYLMNFPLDGITAGGSSTKLAFSYNAGTNYTTVSYTSEAGYGHNFTLLLVGNIALDDTDFVFSNTRGVGVGDTMQGTAQGDGLLGTTGDDYIYSNGSEAGLSLEYVRGDLVHGNDGNDYIRTLGQAYGGNGNDTIVGPSGGWIYGQAGDDVIIISGYTSLGPGNDIRVGGTGADFANTESGNDWVMTFDGNDSMDGSSGNDTLIGGAGNDSMAAGANLDTVIGGAGLDTMSGGTGAGNNDEFWYFATTESTLASSDIITDFTPSADKVFIHPYTGATAAAQLDYTTTTTIGATTYTVLKFTVASGLDANFRVLLQGDLTATLGAGDFMFGNAPYTLNPAGENYTGNAGTAAGGADFITGSANADTIIGNGGADVIYAGAGGDIVTGGPAAGDSWFDELHGEDGNDTITGGNGFDTLYGENNDDELHGGDGYDSLDGGSGNDTLYGDNDIDTLIGGLGNDSLYGGNGIDSLDGGGGVDKIFGEAGEDVIVYDSSDISNDGVTDLSGGSGIDNLIGIATGAALNNGTLDGVDIVGIERFETANTGVTVMVFNAAYDNGVGVDSIYGGVIAVDGSANTTAGNTLNIDGSALDTKLVFSGGRGNDTLTGGTAADLLSGASGNDVLTGNNGNDTLLGGLGNDTLTGGAGNDIFSYVYMQESTTTGTDRIADFTNGQDKFQFSGIDWYGKSFADFTIALSGVDTTITLTQPLSGGPAFQILLTGDHTAELDASDFLFS